MMSACPTAVQDVFNATIFSVKNGEHENVVVSMLPIFTPLGTSLIENFEHGTSRNIYGQGVVIYHARQVRVGVLP